MFLDTYYSQADSKILVTPQQASDFAKQVADDFNPIHNPDAKRFCVPGDLLFSLVLAKYGLSQKMCFIFSGMVGNGVPLDFPESTADKLDITDDNGKLYLTVERQGNISRDENMIADLIRSYVAFSGHNFPHVLLPLMAAKNVMINPDRPLVIYESMFIQLDRLDIDNPTLQPTENTLEVKGKRGDVQLNFCIKSNDAIVGTGMKKLVLSGLREYREEDVNRMVDAYAASKQVYLAK